MRIQCPMCSSLIAAEQMNVAADTVVCQECDGAFSLSEIIAAGGGSDDFDIQTPPPGAWFERTMTGWEVGATTYQSAGVAFFMALFFCLWTCFSFGLILGMWNDRDELSPMHWVLGIVLVLGACALAFLIPMAIWGKVVVSVNRNEGTVFTGIGLVGFTHHFDWSDVTRVEEDWSGEDDERAGNAIVLSGQSDVLFGKLLSNERRIYILQVLRKLLSERNRETS